MSLGDKGWTYRVQCIANGIDEQVLKHMFQKEDIDYVQIRSLVPAADDENGTGDQVATVFFKPKQPHELRLQLDDCSRLVLDKVFLGFTPLNAPVGNAVADVIAITGLAGHAFGSWALRHDQMWLRDYLPDDLYQKVRVLIYGYDSQIQGENPPTSILRDHGKRFVSELLRIRGKVQSQSRPIILIGHSLGGLIVKQALSDMLPDERSKLPVKQIIFLGVPHGGLDVGALAGVVRGKPSEQLIEELQRGSSTLHHLATWFADNIKDLDIHTFHEDRRTPTVTKGSDGKLSRTGEPVLMVDSTSAIMYHPCEKTRIPANGNHSEIAKLQRGEGNIYKNIKYFIEELLGLQAPTSAPDRPLSVAASTTLVTENFAQHSRHRAASYTETSDIRRTERPLDFRETGFRSLDYRGAPKARRSELHTSQPHPIVADPRASSASHKLRYSLDSEQAEAGAEQHSTSSSLATPSHAPGPWLSASSRDWAAGSQHLLSSWAELEAEALRLTPQTDLITEPLDGTMGTISANANKKPKTGSGSDYFAHLKRATASSRNGSKSDHQRNATKIVVIDSGAGLPYFDGTTTDEARPIAERRSWCNEDDDIYGRVESGEFGRKDPIGTGTLATFLVSNAIENSNCRVYSAKVFTTYTGRILQTGGKLVDAYIAIARAMRYAVDFWEVDIISVSFGFQEGVSMLHDAVNYCAKKTIIFVAASCDPDPESKNWFAQHPDVIPVFATDENGDPYARNPAPKKDQNNFAFPGYWRAKPSISSLDPGVIAISSGTCCAAPLAAGVGALLLAQLPGAVEQGLSNLDESLDLKQFRKSLRTASGMKAAFTAMSKERRGYDCVQPWLAFEDENVLQRIVQHLLSTGTF